MDASEPPHIVFEASAPCRDDDRAALLEGLGAAHGLDAAWTVRAHIVRDGAGLKAAGEITDGSGAPAVRRELVGSLAQCAGLARAIGVWAGLVLDAREPHDGASAVTPDPNPVPSIGAGADPGAAVWQPPPMPDHPAHHEEDLALELGAGVFLMSSTGGGAVAGPSLFGVIETGKGIFLRPSAALGQAITALPPADVKSATWAAARLDACARLPGYYARRHGIQLDLCLGGDFGLTVIDAADRTTLPYVGLGPSLDLRGELGSRLSAVIRLVAGIDVVPASSFQDESGATEEAPLFAARLELAVSWDAR